MFRYLLADCNEAFVKIKMAFRPGMVDLPEDKREAAMNAITLPDVFHDFDTNMPDLDDMDMGQFSINQSRAEEITMREDYGNITLSTGDDGFGDTMDMEAPEMLRDAPHGMDTFGDELSLESEAAKSRDPPGGGGLELTDPSTSAAAKQMDAPIGDDGFGGSGLPDILSGGLFEEGSLFGEPLAEHPPPPESSIGGGEDFGGGAPSPMHSDDDSRPATPMEDVPGLDVPAPQLDQTPAAVAPSPAPTSPTPSLQSTAPSAAETESAAAQKQQPHDTTTLLHNEEESFALAPVEASVLKGEKRKRKRKLVVDDIKAITGEGMKIQLSDSTDIVTTLDIAPPTKRLMHWKETGGVDELFNLPARNLGSKALTVYYKKCLKMKTAAEEQRDNGEKLNLEYIGVEQEFERERKAPPKAERAPKRKRQDSESAYAKRQQELVRQAEESAREEERARRRVSRGAEGADVSTLEASRASERLANKSADAADLPASPGSPAAAQQSGLFGDEAPSAAAGPPAADLTEPATSFTEQWVNQVQPEQDMMSPPHDDDDHAPAEDLPDHDDYDDDDVAPGDGLDDDAVDDDEEEDNEMQEDETIEQYEDRVLNKRAAQMHRLLAKRFADQPRLQMTDMLRRNNRKQAAQKFYSVLVLQKVMAVDADQASQSFSPIAVLKGNKFEAAIKLL